MKRDLQNARLGVALILTCLLPVRASATTIAQNSSWTVTRTGATQTLRIVAYGDSIFAGYTSATTVARRAAPYVMGEYCAALLGQNFNVARRCQSGGVAQDIYNRIHSTADRAFMADASTRVVMFEMCGNDYLQARSNFKGSSGTCNYSGLNTAFNNCKNYTGLAMDDINQFANVNTKLKIVSNLYYPGFNADNAFSGCTDAVNGDPANGFKVNMQNLFLPRLLESNWWTCKIAGDKGFLCADSFAQYMARDYDSNSDGMIDSDAIRYQAGESLADYQARVLALRSTLRDANFKLVDASTSFDYIQSDDTHPTFEGATASTFLTTPSGNNPVFFATAGPYPDGKNPHWNQNGHDRMGWGLDPGCPFTLVACGNGAVETDYLPSGTARTEGCDDGNLTAGDGCSSTCAVEEGYACSGSPSMCAPVCGDGFVTGPEQCDDGEVNGGDGCSATCTVEPGFSCMGHPSSCQHICGDGLVVIGEVCDDGNVDAEDGCSAGCTVEGGWTCAGEPSMCAPVCGDGLILGTEECDDGEANGTTSSCCSSTCNFQALSTACDDGDICTDNDACDGANTCSGGPATCDDGNSCTDDSCDGQVGCTHSDNTDPCDDGNACTTTDTCGGGECQSGPALDCDDGNVCTDEVCNPEDGCHYSDNSASCDDGNACTASDTCSNGTCGGSTISCDDGNVCTDDSCNPASGCAYANNSAPCSDGESCTAPDVCSAGMCTSGPPVYGFSGFLSPVDNPPVVNVGKAGQNYPVKWKLPLCSGGYVSRLNAVVYNPLRVQQVNCDTNAIEDTLTTDNPGSTSLTYDSASNQYHYNWKSGSAYAGKCYELLLELDNGTTQVAKFRFK